MPRQTHELKIYSSVNHECGRFGQLLLHLWFGSEWLMNMDLEIALSRKDVGYVEVIDCINHTTEKRYPNAQTQ